MMRKIQFTHTWRLRHMSCSSMVLLTLLNSPNTVRTYSDLLGDEWSFYRAEMGFLVVKPGPRNAVTLPSFDTPTCQCQVTVRSPHQRLVVGVSTGFRQFVP